MKDKNKSFLRADEIIKKYNIKNPPITNDLLIRIIEDFGIEYYEMPMKDNVSGLFEIRDGIKRIIINNEHHINRKRFTAAHEIGHYLLHSSSRDSIHIDYRDYRKNNDNGKIRDKKEHEADNFSGALLMPEELVDEKISEYIHYLNEDELISKLAQEFKVSTAAMTVRLQILGYSFL